MKRIIASCLGAGCLVLSAGCMGPATSGISAERGILRVENRAFASRVEVVKDQTVLLNGGFLKAQVTVRNTQQQDATMSYRFTWKDRDGMTLTNGDTPWRPLVMHGREETVLEAVCPVRGAADFRLVIRPSKNP